MEQEVRKVYLYIQNDDGRQVVLDGIYDTAFPAPEAYHLNL